jgi:hypothetical protein
MVRARISLLDISRSFLLFTIFLGVACAAQAQSAGRPLISQTIDESSLVTLRGNVHPLAKPRFDRGPAPDSMPLQRLVIVLKRSPQQERALQQYLDSLQDKNSPHFHRFLTPGDFGRLYGPANEDVEQVVAWLSRHGFSVARVPKSNMTIEFSGSVGQIEAAFHTEIHRFSIEGHEHFSNISDPMIPAALAPVVVGVSPLNTFYPHPQVIHGPSGRWNAAEKRFDPDLTITASGTPYLFVGAGDAATIYDSPNALNAKLPSGQATYDGTGITIGIVSDENINVQNIVNYRSLFGLPAGSISIVTDGNAPNSSLDDTESTLDGEVSGAIAPGAKIVYYQAGDTTLQSGVMLAILRAIEDNTVNILNVSYSGCELAEGAAGNQEILNAWEQAAAQGIAVTVSSGDSGSAGCDNPDTETAASRGFGVNALASTPYTVAVGGTDFDVLPTRFPQYVSSTNSPNQTSALGYISEKPWNNSTKSNGTAANNEATESSSGATNIVGGGGGASSAALYDSSGNILGGYTKPLWQQQYETSAGIAADHVRDVPDVSLFAANGFYHAVWATCGDSDCSGSNPTISGLGGTSASAPAFAGILALLNQKAGAATRLGQPNWSLYELASTHPESFHQITTGNNAVVCTQGTPNCALSNFLSGYDAAASYNLATGLGSIDISSLVNNWTSVAKTPTATTLSVNPTSFQHGAAITIGIGVNPTGATGNVAVITDNNETTGGMRNDSQTNYTLADGEAAGTWSGFPGGTYDVYANYAGDGTYAGSISAPMQISVTPESSIVQLSLTTVNSSGQVVSLAGGTIPYSTYVSVDAQPIGQSQASKPNPLRDATGAVTFSDTGVGGNGTANVDASGNAELPVHYFTAGSHSIAASYIGDKSYSPSTSATVSFTVQKATATTSLTSSANSIASGDVTLTGRVNPVVPEYVLPALDGTITFTDTTNNTVLGTMVVSAAGNSTTGFNGMTYIDVAVTQLALGNNSIVATYNGGTNFAASSPSTPVIVVCTAGCGNGTGESLGLAFYSSTPPSHIISPGTTSTTPVAVNSEGGFTGAVNLTCSVTGSKSGDVNIPQCSFNPATVTITSTNAVQSTLTVTTTAPGTSAALAPGNPLWSATQGGLTLACFMFLGLSTRRRSLSMLRVFLCLIILGGMTACGGGGVNSQSGGGGGGGGGGSVTPGTSPDTYTITFHAADAATGVLTAQDYFTLQVN